jgi:hypothetical protein
MVARILVLLLLAALIYMNVVRLRRASHTFGKDEPDDPKVQR